MRSWLRQPFVGLALAAGAGIAVADRWPSDSAAAVVVALLFASAAFVLRRSLAVYASVAAGFFYIHSAARIESPGQELARSLGNATNAASVGGLVVTDPKTTPNGFSSFLLQLRTIEVDGAQKPSSAIVFVRWKGTPQFGDELALFGVMQPVAPPRNPGEFDMQSYLARRDVRDELIVRYAENGHVVHHAGGNLVLRAAQESRDWMQRVLGRGLEDSPTVEGLIDGMVLGLRHQAPEDIEEPFQQTGTLHLFAVAGLHVGIVAQLLWSIAAVARLPRKWATALIIPALLFYAAITGFHTSSVRAALMASVLLAGYFVERRVFVLNSLAAAAMLILCWDTNELFAVGFQLSFAVVATIILLTEPTFRLLRRAFAGDPFLPQSLFNRWRRWSKQILRWLARAAAVSFAAWIGSLPLMLHYYHLVTPISLLANLLVIPIAYCVLAGGLMSLVVAPLSTWLSVIFNNANWAAAQLILGIVHLFALLPTGHFYVAEPRWSKRALLEVEVLDVGAGAAISLATGAQNWMFDCGGRRDYERFVREYLRSKGVNRLDGLLLTHGDSAHIGGAILLRRDFRPRQIVDFGGHDRSRVHAAFTAELSAAHVAPRLCAAGDELAILGRVSARVLFPPHGFEGETSDDQALVTQISVDGRPRILFMSDTGAATERTLLTTGSPLHADVLVRGQHHAGTVCSTEFLNAVQPDLIVASSHDFPPWEQINDEWVETLRLRGITLMRQDQTGAVALRFYPNRWEAEPFLQGEIFRSRNR